VFVTFVMYNIVDKMLAAAFSAVLLCRFERGFNMCNFVNC
jgi:hypothetical protein